MFSSTFCVSPGTVKFDEPTKRLRTHDVELAVGDVRLRVELVLLVDAALDLPVGHRLGDRRHAVEERVVALVVLEAGVDRSAALAA